jgi:uncharacterized phage protein gp47/JayE
MSGIGTLTATGIQTPIAQEIYDAKVEALQSAGFDTSIQSLTGFLVGLQAEAEAKLYELATASYYSAFTNLASDTSLDNASGNTGVSRLLGKPSRILQAQLTTIGVVSVFIPKGTQVKQSSTGVVWQTIQDVTIPASGSVVTEVDSITDGAFSAAIGTLDTIVNTIAGFDSVTNLGTSLQGRLTETDAELKRRRKLSLVISTGGTLQAIVNRVKNEVDGVTYCSGNQNRTNATVDSLPPHSISITVLGGTDADIGAKLLETVPAGIGTYGTETILVVDEYGNNNTFYFDRITEKPVYLIVNVTDDGSFNTDDITTIKNLLLDYFSLLGNGSDVINWKLIGALEAVNGISDINIKQGFSPTPTLSSNLVIGNNEKATLDIANITVNVI